MDGGLARARNNGGVTGTAAAGGMSNADQIISEGKGDTTYINMHHCKLHSLEDESLGGAEYIQSGAAYSA